MLPNDQRGSGPAVLLLHAGVADRRMWAGHVDRLAESGYHAIAIDLPGFGEAPVGSGPQAPWEDVLLTLRELDVNEAALVGNSFGGAVALRVAAIAPAAVRGLMLVSAPPLNLEPSPALAAAWEAEEAALDRGDLDGAVAAVLDAWVQPDAPPELRERLATMQRRALELQSAAGAAEEGPDPLEQHPDALDRVRMPVLAVFGEADMQDFKDAAEEFAGRLPQTRVEAIPGVGHLAPLEAPEEFMRLLLQFLGQSS